MTPYDLTPGSGKEKIWWTCPLFASHEWRATPADRLRHGCPHCKESKGEKAVALALTKLGISYEREYKFDTCKIKRRLPFDFIMNIKGKILAIEYHGEHHYQAVAFGSHRLNPDVMFEIVKIRDRVKYQWCRNNKIPLLVIPYWNYEEIEILVTEFVDKHTTQSL